MDYIILERTERKWFAKFKVDVFYIKDQELTSDGNTGTKLRKLETMSSSIIKILEYTIHEARLYVSLSRMGYM